MHKILSQEKNNAPINHHSELQKLEVHERNTSNCTRKSCKDNAVSSSKRFGVAIMPHNKFNHMKVGNTKLTT